MDDSNAQPTPSQPSKKRSLAVSLGARIKELRRLVAEFLPDYLALVDRDSAQRLDLST